MRTSLRAALLLAVVVVLMAACSADEKKDQGTSGAPISAASSSSSSSADEGTTAVAALDVRAVENGDQYSFDLGGATTVPSGPVAVTLTNNGTQVHQATLVKIKSGNFADVQAAVAGGSRPDVAVLGLGTFASGPNAVAPGQTGTVTTVVLPGTYAIVDLLTAADNRSNAQHGMVAQLTVPQPLGATAVPSTGIGQISITDSGFTAPPGFNGNGTYTVANDGSRLHDLAILQVPAGTNASDPATVADPAGRTTLPAFGGVTALAPGATVTVDLRLTPGAYAFVSLQPDTTQNNYPLDFLGGMTTVVNVPVT